MATLKMSSIRDEDGLSAHSPQTIIGAGQFDGGPAFATILKYMEGFGLPRSQREG